MESVALGRARRLCVGVAGYRISIFVGVGYAPEVNRTTCGIRVLIQSYVSMTTRKHTLFNYAITQHQAINYIRNVVVSRLSIVPLMVNHSKEVELVRDEEKHRWNITECTRLN